MLTLGFNDDRGCVVGATIVFLFFFMCGLKIFALLYLDICPIFFYFKIKIK
jgi:hypothetical protein